MAGILIVYASDYGNTRKAAEMVAAGAQRVAGTTVVVREAEHVTLEELLAADALVLGSPVHMGSMDWRVKKFIDTVCSRAWVKDALVGKVGAVFTTGGGLGNSGGGAELTMLSMINNLAELGVVIVPLPKNTPGYTKAGLQWGPNGRSGDESGKPVGIHDATHEVFQHHGAHVAKVAAAIKDKGIFA